MGFFKKLFSGSDDIGTVKFLRKEKAPNAIYEIYQAPDAESAKNYLSTKKITEDKYYILVETPEGAWGLDKLGIYLEKLLPFQFDINSVDCNGSTCGIPDMAGLEMAANGINESFVINIECGKCKNQWLDAVRYQQVTVVKCPKCKSLNKINTENIHRVTTIHYKLFEMFLEGLSVEGRETAKEAMSSISLSHELFVIYADNSLFSKNMKFAEQLPNNYHPICMKFDNGGVIYLRCNFMNESEYQEIYNSFKEGSKKIYIIPDPTEVAINGIK